MAQQDKGRLYRALQAEGVTFSKHYRDYSTADLQTAWDALREAKPHLPETPLEDQPAAAAPVPRTSAPLDEMPGQRLNTLHEGPIRVDEMGREWYQEEVRKPEYPKARGRRVLTYNDTGTEQQTVTTPDGMTETFEIAGQGQGRQMQAKITLPSYQVGIYKDPRFPFKIHEYNDTRGFDLFEVEEFYGGADLVPAGVKRMYVESSLCYDIRTVVRAIEDEARHLQLTGRLSL